MIFNKEKAELIIEVIEGKKEETEVTLKELQDFHQFVETYLANSLPQTV